MIEINKVYNEDCLVGMQSIDSEILKLKKRYTIE